MKYNPIPTRPLIAIDCRTFNQELYIKDTLEGFVGQKTNFPFVAILHDDASSDHTADIIQEYAERYPHIIIPIIEKENQYSKNDGSLTKIMNEAIASTGAKYMANCEGDDYWTDPLKLQKQVDFLESHPDYGLSYSRVKRFVQDKNKFEDTWGGPSESFQTLILDNTIPTPTVVYRTELYFKYISEIDTSGQDWLMGDYPIWLYLAANSKIHFLPEATAVYRILSDSASHSKDYTKVFRFGLNSREIALFFANKYSNLLDAKTFERVKEDYVWYSLLYQCLKYNKTDVDFLKANKNIIDGFTGKRALIKHLFAFPSLVKLFINLNK